MIRMSRADCRVIQTIWVIALVIAGCCGSGPTHKCDFTPPDQSGIDAGSDGPMLCGTAVCEVPQVCCYKKAPPLALCIDAVNFEPFGCEKMDLPCLGPADCPEGTACCFNRDDFSVACKPQILCLGDGRPTFVACTTSMDCPITNPSCNNVGMSMTGDPFNICGTLDMPP